MVSVAPPIARQTFAEETKAFTASQWQLMRWRFMKHKMAVVSRALLACFYGVASCCEFIAPHDPHRHEVRYLLAPPQKIHFVDETGFHLRPFVYGYKSSRDPATLRMTHEIDKTKKHPIRFLQRGDKYKFWGIWRTDLHLFGIEDRARFCFYSVPMNRDGMCSRGSYTVLASRFPSASWA